MTDVDAAPWTLKTRISKYLDVERIARRVRCDVGRCISTLGEWLNKPHMVYNPFIMQHYNFLGRTNAPMAVKIFEHLFPNAQRWVDIGAGPGAYAAAAMRRGKRVVACENSGAARRIARESGVDIRPFDLTLPVPAELDGPFDLAFCIEVAEHLPPDLGDRLVEFIAQQAPTILFSAAQPPPRGGIGHINEQPREYWIERFEKQGLSYNDALSHRAMRLFARHCPTAWWLGQNVSIFEK